MPVENSRDVWLPQHTLPAAGFGLKTMLQLDQLCELRRSLELCQLFFFLMIAGVISWAEFVIKWRRTKEKPCLIAALDC